MRIHTQGAWLNRHMGAAREEREENYLICFRCIKNVCSVQLKANQMGKKEGLIIRLQDLLDSNL